MVTDRPSCSLLKALSKGSFEVSLITTYNAYLPYYEQVVLSRLLASGCRHNVVLMDARQYHRCLADPSQRPRLAGFEYSLIPIRAAGAFHPKILFLGSRKRALLCIGSHNLTLSGFGLNRELTNRIDIDGPSDGTGIAIAQTAWRFLQAWIGQPQQRFPDALRQAINATAELCPWLSKSPTSAGDDFLLGNSPTGPSLWEQLQTHIRYPVKRVLVLGAFFDQQLGFLDHLRQTLQPASITVGIEPDTVDIPRNAARTPGIRFVNAKALAGKEDYLHAKALYLDSDGIEDLLITGSANPSVPAWLGVHSRRNAEVMLVRKGDAARAAAEALGLIELESMPALTKDDWSGIEQRPRQHPTPTSGSSLSTPIVEIVDDVISITLETGQTVVIDLLDGDSQVLATFDRLALTQTDLRLPCEAAVRDQLRLIRLRFADGRCVLTHVHHSQRIRQRAQTPNQARFNAALGSLGGDNPDLASLITTVEKMIFDQPVDIQPRRNTGHPVEQTRSVEPQELGSLAVNLADTQRHKRRYRRLVGSGDLAHLLDVLIHHLGIGLAALPSGLDSQGRTEEERIGSDDDTDERRPPPPVDLLKIAHIKIRHLIQRMLQQLEQATTATGESPAVVAKLVATLAVLRELRKLDNRADWIPRGKTLVPFEQRRRLLDGALGYLFGRHHKLYDQTLAQVDTAAEPVDEITRLNGLLLWLAWDCGITLRGKAMAETLEDQASRLQDQAKLLLLWPLAVDNDLAWGEARDSLLEVASPDRQNAGMAWLKKSEAFGRQLRRCSVRLDDLAGDTFPEPGDLARLPDEPATRFRVVLGIADRNIRLADLSPGKPLIAFRIGSISTIPFRNITSH